MAAQASVELVAVIPAIVFAVLIAGQGVAAGWALWSAGNAARAGARAEQVGADGEATARRALPGRLRAGAEIRAEEEVRVRVRVPPILPGLELPAVAASSTLAASAGGG